MALKNTPLLFNTLRFKGHNVHALIQYFDHQNYIGSESLHYVPRFMLGDYNDPFDSKLFSVMDHVHDKMLQKPLKRYRCSR